MLKNTTHLFFFHCWTQAFGIIKVVRFLKTKAKKVHMQNDKPMLFSNTIWLSMSLVHMHQNTSEFSHYHKNIIKYSTKFDLKIIVHPCNFSNSFIFPLVVLFNLFFFFFLNYTQIVNHTISLYIKGTWTCCDCINIESIYFTHFSTDFGFVLHFLLFKS